MINKDVHDFVEDINDTTEEGLVLHKKDFRELKTAIQSGIETQGTTTVKGEDIETPVGEALQALYEQILQAEESGLDHIVIKEREALFLADVFGG